MGIQNFLSENGTEFWRAELWKNIRKQKAGKSEVINDGKIVFWLLDSKTYKNWTVYTKNISQYKILLTNITTDD